MSSAYVELELLDKQRVLFHPYDWNKIYKLVERSRTVARFTKKFPFVEFKKLPYVTFKLRTEYEYLDSISDPRYNVNCTLREFAALFGKDIVPFEETIVKHNIHQL